MGKLSFHIVIWCVLLVGCAQPARMSLGRNGNVSYYWQVTFALDSVQSDFLHRHDIRCLYCRYFDVVNDPEQGPMPNATVQFATPVPSGIEIVPTVFIMNDCMQVWPDSLARRIVRRVVQMNETNDIGGVRELQIDCDYTARNRELYYRFLEEVRYEASAAGMALSTTVRLHQLSMPAPPVDYGVLMLYNTGSPDRFAERNPILDMRDVKPYLRYLHDYPLPLAAAYPVFLWQRNIHGVRIDHVAPFDEIVRCKQAVEAERDDLRQLVFTYHLDSENINRYTPEQYETIYRH